jgi:hypothetical protein
MQQVPAGVKRNATTAEIHQTAEYSSEDKSVGAVLTILSVADRT